MSIAALTAAEKRQIRDYNPSLSDRPPGFDLAAKIDALITGINSAAVASNVVSGTADIASGASSVAIALPASHDGSTVMAVLQEDDGATRSVRSCVWDGSGGLTISTTAVTSKIVTVGYFYVIGQ